LAVLLALGWTAARGQIDRPFLSLEAANWLEQPSMAEFQAAKPKQVSTRGYVILKCGAQADGRLTDCARLIEDPKAEGLLAAALSLVPKFRLEPTEARFAHDAGAKVTVQFNWPGEGGPCYPPYCSFIPPPPPAAGSH
jgi:hypothetical protein